MPDFCTNRTDSRPVCHPSDHSFSADAGPEHLQNPATDTRGPGVTDLRRRDARLHAEQITGRAVFLSRAERAFVLAVYEQGRSISDLAVLSGRSPRSLRRELRRILRRITSPEFAFVVVHRESWPSTTRRVAQACIIDGIPVRRATQTLRLSLHTVRKHREIIRMLAAGAPAPALTPSRSVRG